MIRVLILSFLVFFISACSTKSFTFNNYNNLEQNLRMSAAKWKKTPYKLGGTSYKKGADCSAFTQSIFAEFSTKLPRTTAMQLKSGAKISKNKLKTGDLVFFKTGQGPNQMHVGIYLSSGKFMHLSTKGGMKEVSINEKYWKSRFIGARRVNIN